MTKSISVTRNTISHSFDNSGCNVLALCDIDDDLLPELICGDRDGNLFIYKLFHHHDPSKSTTGTLTDPSKSKAVEKSDTAEGILKNLFSSTQKLTISEKPEAKNAQSTTSVHSMYKRKLAEAQSCRFQVDANYFHVGKLGFISAFAVGDVLNRRKSIYFTVINAEGNCTVFEVNGRLVHRGDIDDEDQFVRAYQQTLQANIVSAYVQDIDGDGNAELLVGLTDRVIRSYRYSFSSGFSSKGKDIGCFIAIMKWEIPDQITCLSFCPLTNTMFVSQPDNRVIVIKTDLSPTPTIEMDDRTKLTRREAISLEGLVEDAVVVHTTRSEKIGTCAKNHIFVFPHVTVDKISVASRHDETKGRFIEHFSILLADAVFAIEMIRAQDKSFIFTCDHDGCVLVFDITNSDRKENEKMLPKLKIDLNMRVTKFHAKLLEFDPMIYMCYAVPYFDSIMISSVKLSELI